MGRPGLKAKNISKQRWSPGCIVDGDYTIEDVMAHYGLTAAEAHAAMACYYDNQAELDATRERVLAEIRENAMPLEKFKASLADRNSEE
jgi:hypothetical protein